jgi:hypothetical protein
MKQASVSSTGPGRREAAWLRHGGIKFSTARRLAGRHAVDAGGVSISPGRFVNSTPLTWGISTVTRRCDMSRGVRIFRVGRRGARLIERQPAVRSPDPDHAVQGCRPAPMFTPRPPSPQASVSLDGPRRREAAGLGLVDHRNLRRERPRQWGCNAEVSCVRVAGGPVPAAY